MERKTIIIILVNLTVLLVTLRIVFKSFRNAFKALIYFLLPGDIFVFTRKWEKSFDYSHKVSLIIILLIALIFVEYLIFY